MIDGHFSLPQSAIFEARNWLAARFWTNVHGTMRNQSTTRLGPRKSMRYVVIVSAAVAALAFTGCRGGTSSNASPSTTGASASTTTTYDTALDVTTINNAPVPGEMLPEQNVFVMLDTIDAHGNRLKTSQGTRKAGTRVAIHTHEFSGQTCVLSGVITDFVEGHEPMEWPAGTCYYMPPNTLMSAANLGTEDAVLIDTFNQPPDTPLITIREPGWPSD
jgi:quercetin dioxygenase-like cupin family protein